MGKTGRKNKVYSAKQVLSWICENTITDIGKPQESMGKY